ncbi:uncharacterized protein ELE39_000059 [Cryptosporidium sp. chipmunk genotype I]|uniref:uncharacterized protein n=1 Tax=Cryptosporidium sp. chipmunk genotype I TaxID=1280935 RepID=UPI00351A080B|nr:hypothetical protein ELE39_000059 [Cryptosporidium sp. chipmunk genotype I]
MLGKGDYNVYDSEGSSLEDGMGNLIEDELAEMVLLQEVHDLRLEKKKIRVAGIVKFVDLIEQELAIFYESRSLRVSLRYGFGLMKYMILWKESKCIVYDY